MRVRKLTPDGDYSFGNSQLDFLRDSPEAVGQQVKTRLLLWLGEWFLDTEEGTQYMQGVLGKHSQETADAVIQDRVLSTDNVTDITNYVSTIDPDTRKMSVSFDLDTVFGPTQIQLENYANY